MTAVTLTRTDHARRMARFYVLDVQPDTVDSLDKDLQKNADGSVDIYVGPKAPTGSRPRSVFWALTVYASCSSATGARKSTNKGHRDSANRVDIGQAQKH